MSGQGSVEGLAQGFGMTTTYSPETWRAAYSCPDWCTTSEEHHADDDPGKALHSGAVVGRFSVWQTTGEEPTVTMQSGISGDDALTVAELRALVSDVVAAAEWLEAHQ